MFQGSEHHDTEYFGPLEKLGAQINGSTTHRPDQLLRGPPDQRPGDRPLARIRPDGLPPAGADPGQARQPARRGQERAPAAGRQRPLRPGPGAASTRPSTRPDHPYHHSVIGSMADLSAASLGDVATFFRTYYSPNNASLTIAGDINPAEARRLVEKYFGPIPRGPEVAKLAAERADPDRAEAADHDRRRPARPDPARLADRRRWATPTRPRSTPWPRSSASSPTRAASSGPSSTTSSSPPRPPPSTSPAPCRAPSASRSPPSGARSSTT